MHIAIVDDCQSDIDALHDGVCQYCRQHKIHMKIHKFSNEALFLHSAKEVSYSLVFLDIYMQQTTGLVIAKKLRDLTPDCQIVFTTASKEHAVNAFRLQALDYLVKPINYSDLNETMTRYQNTVAKFCHYIELKEGRHFTRVLISDIIYTDYSNHYIQVHTPSCVVRSYMSFDEFSPMLESYPQFLWCYRNCMVNMDYIEAMEAKDFVLKNDERIPIATARKKEIRQAYANYIFDYINGGTSV